MKTFSLAAMLAATLLAGCGTLPETVVQTPLTARPQAATAMAPPANGAIFQNATYRPIFEDRRARLVGDTITIVINENSSAGKNAGSSGSKTGSVAAAAPNLFGLFGGVTDNLSATASTSSKFEDKGAVTSSNNFASTLTVTVIEVLQNGNLLVAGEKQVSLDKGAEFIRFSGVVNPNTVSGNNIVSSTNVADARIEYRTNSRIDAAAVMGMLTRFFLSVVPL
ncbi:flagellar basal body L-ring protein FlgH [uncultured Oxalicibacterium sp.]|uniref:flagellar basal body L-ring protein FlgH n=1 Tax=uncultured Oxalicibacterium sp. TaxID=1168540 RepID=UPI0025E90BE0|nr:flagellar basal body L-ring protein FlgH [uncultured Oxalicibacterium sp.]